MSTFIWTAILCDIFASEINTYYYGNMVRVRWLKNSSIIVESCLYEYDIHAVKN